MHSLLVEGVDLVLAKHKRRGRNMLEKIVVALIVGGIVLVVSGRWAVGASRDVLRLGELDLDSAGEFPSRRRLVWHLVYAHGALSGLVNMVGLTNGLMAAILAMLIMA